MIRTPVKASEVAAVLESIAPISTGTPGDQLGFIYGDPNRLVTDVACMWNAHSASIRHAVELGAQMLIVHETLFYATQESNWYVGPRHVDDIPANMHRKILLNRDGLVVYRSHSNWDALDVDGVPDQAVKALGIAGLRVIGRQKFFKVHQMPSPMSLKELSCRAQEALGLPVVRLFGDTGQQITRFAFLIGGFGENQTHMPQAARELGAEAVIIGEMNEFEVIAAMECGLSVIETLHSRSEIPAIQRQAEMLAGKLPQICFHYVKSGSLDFVYRPHADR